MMKTNSQVVVIIIRGSFSLHPAAKINVTHGDTAALASPAPSSANPSNTVLNSKVSELACVCVGFGMAPPEYSFIPNRQVTI